MLISGRLPDWALHSASVGYLHKATYLMQDGRYVHYRQRTGVNMNEAVGAFHWEWGQCVAGIKCMP